MHSSKSDSTVLPLSHAEACLLPPQLNLVGTLLNQQGQQDQQIQQGLLGQQQQQDQQIQKQLNQDHQNQNSLTQAQVQQDQQLQNQLNQDQQQQGRHLMSFLNGINTDINNKVRLACHPHSLGCLRIAFCVLQLALFALR